MCVIYATIQTYLLYRGMVFFSCDRVIAFQKNGNTKITSEHSFTYKKWNRDESALNIGRINTYGDCKNCTLLRLEVTTFIVLCHVNI